MPQQTDVMDLVSNLKLRGEAFVLATVVRTVAVTAAKAGAKAVIMPDGTITGGWIGGGCARGAVLKAAQDVLADGQPRLISVQPPVELEALGVAPGESRHGGALPATCAQAREPWIYSWSRSCPIPTS